MKNATAEYPHNPPAELPRALDRRPAGSWLSFYYATEADARAVLEWIRGAPFARFGLCELPDGRWCLDVHHDNDRSPPVKPRT